MSYAMDFWDQHPNCKKDTGSFVRRKAIRATLYLIRQSYTLGSGIKSASRSRGELVHKVYDSQKSVV